MNTLEELADMYCSTLLQINDEKFPRLIVGESADMCKDVDTGSAD